MSQTACVKMVCPPYAASLTATAASMPGPRTLNVFVRWFRRATILPAGAHEMPSRTRMPAKMRRPSRARSSPHPDMDRILFGHFVSSRRECT
jgi:hypothetical protein